MFQAQLKSSKYFCLSAPSRCLLSFLGASLLLACAGTQPALRCADPLPESPQAEAEPEPVLPLIGLAENHFDPQGKVPSEATLALRAEAKSQLSLADRLDFEEASRGLLKVPESSAIKDADGNIVWDLSPYKFLLDEKELPSIHPSLERNARLNMNAGLYEVSPGIYQVRGFDLSNISFIKGNKGWIVMDPLVSKETAAAALKLINDTLGERPVTVVIYSHSHLDHFGGVRGIIDEKDVKSGKVTVIAPKGFMEHAVSENIFAGNAMMRRADYQYGRRLEPNPYGHVDQAIGKATSTGSIGLIAPNKTITKDEETLTLDGVKMIFQSTPGTEAPAEMNTYFPKQKAFWAAENITATIHNIYTLRGAEVRDALAWSKYIARALYSYGQEAEVMFAAHSWPRFGNELIQSVMRTQRDAYAHMNNQVLHLANEGVTINEIHNVYHLPDELAKEWPARAYHGSYAHNTRAVINKHLGYWDGNPTTLMPVSPADSAGLYVEMMGGSEAIINRASQLFSKGEYRLASEILNKLVYAEPNNQKAKNLLADTFEQIGYQAESTSVRNVFLSAAYELRHGINRSKKVAATGGADLITAMSGEMFFEYLGILVDSDKLGSLKARINVKLSDPKEELLVEVSHGTLTVLNGVQLKDAELSLDIPREAFNRLMLKQATFESLLNENQIKSSGDTSILKSIGQAMVTPDPVFELMPGTEPTKAEPTKAEPTKAEPTKAEPTKAEPTKAEPTKAEPTPTNTH